MKCINYTNCILAFTALYELACSSVQLSISVLHMTNWNLYMSEFFKRYLCRSLPLTGLKNQFVHTEFIFVPVSCLTVPLSFILHGCKRHHWKMKVLLAEQFLCISSLIVPLILNVCNSVPDTRVFWPPGSGSTSQRYGSGSGSVSGSGSFYNHAKIVRKTLNPAIL